MEFLFFEHETVLVDVATQKNNNRTHLGLISEEHMRDKIV